MVATIEVFHCIQNSTKRLMLLHLLVDVLLEPEGGEVRHHCGGVAKTLEGGVHETRVAKVTQPGQQLSLHRGEIYTHINIHYHSTRFFCP